MQRHRILAVIFLFVSIGVYLGKESFVRQMIYPVPSVSVQDLPPAPLQSLLLKRPSGEVVHGWFYKHPSAVRPPILYFHGNGENLETMRLSGMTEEFLKLETSFLWIDYPGYGKSVGTPSEASVLESAGLALATLRDYFPGMPVVVSGWSLGAAVAIQTTARHTGDIAGLIAMSPWTSLPDIARVHFPGWMVRFLLNEQYDSLNAARGIHCPALILHGSQDELIPVEQGENVALAMGSNAHFQAISQTGHNDLLSRREVWTRLKEFLDSVGSQR